MKVLSCCLELLCDCMILCGVMLLLVFEKRTDYKMAAGYYHEENIND